MLTTDIKKLITEGRFGRTVEGVSDEAKKTLYAVVDELSDPKFTLRTFKEIVEGLQKKEIPVAESDVSIALLVLIDADEVRPRTTLSSKVFYRLRGYSAVCVSPVVSTTEIDSSVVRLEASE